jgi:hypothetical protein
MQAATLVGAKIGARPRSRFVRRLRVLIVRWLRARLREESPVIDPIGPAVPSRSGFQIRRGSL